VIARLTISKQLLACQAGPRSRGGKRAGFASICRDGSIGAGAPVDAMAAMTAVPARHVNATSRAA
jgi:hypothetical protein